jgi:hypothetical protein
VLRVRLPILEKEKEVYIGVKAKYFDDLYSNMVFYNGTPPSSPLQTLQKDRKRRENANLLPTGSSTFPTPQKYITPVRAHSVTLDTQIIPVQYPNHFYFKERETREN